MTRGWMFVVGFLFAAYWHNLRTIPELMALVVIVPIAMATAEFITFLLRGLLLMCAVRPAFAVQLVIGTAFFAGSWYFIGSPLSAMQDFVALMEHHQQANAATNDEPRWETTP